MRPVSYGFVGGHNDLDGKRMQKQCTLLTFKLRIVDKKNSQRRQVHPDHVERVCSAESWWKPRTRRWKGICDEVRWRRSSRRRCRLRTRTSPSSSSTSVFSARPSLRFCIMMGLKTGRCEVTIKTKWWENDQLRWFWFDYRLSSNNSTVLNSSSIAEMYLNMIFIYYFCLWIHIQRHCTSAKQRPVIVFLITAINCRSVINLIRQKIGECCWESEKRSCFIYVCYKTSPHQRPQISIVRSIHDTSPEMIKVMIKERRMNSGVRLWKFKTF